MVTLNEVYREGRAIIEEAGLESPAFDAMCLLEPVFGIKDRTRLAVCAAEKVSENDREKFLSLCRERTKRPLQYILGKWEFCGMELKCGEGVLVPREDTMVLVQCAVDALENVDAPQIIDLCAGTGAVGLAVCRMLGQGKCTCVELSEKAFPYLMSNIEAFGDCRVEAKQYDVLKPPDEYFGTVDAILSNPPYIATREINKLEGDVRKEPKMALDGGGDGLMFYRAILDNWLPLLKKGGILAVEIGYDQMEEVLKMFRCAGLAQVCGFQDLSGNDRAIIGTKVN